ncbi:MAG: hypothetical protein OER87_06250 [Gammaproteobacteria bacterium]|nr:hypothetical protein [Gammaproteobacteria bacterium]
MPIKFVSGCRRCVLLVITMLASVPAAGEMHLGVTTGRMSVDVSSSSAPKNMALSLGYEIDTRLANLRLVGEINRTVSRGKTRGGEGLEFESDGIYLLFKTNRPLYFTLRGGVVQDEIITGATTSKDRGFAIGGGIGVISGRARIVIEYTKIAGDADYLSLGLEF